MTVLHVVLPAGVDDPANPSGGNVYDRRLCGELGALGWWVVEHPVGGGWPEPSAADLAGLDTTLSGVPEGGTVLLDGLIASAAPTVLAAHTARLRLAGLVHMPFGDTWPATRATEHAALRSLHSVIATSSWARQRMLEVYGLPPAQVHVAAPGVHVAPSAAGTGTGAALLCVAVVDRHKGHDVLVEALGGVRDLPWTCTCVGSLDRAPGFVRDLTTRLDALGLTDRVRFTGPLVGAALDDSYAAADLLVLPSRGETYGMVVTEALARGVPVAATTAKGLPDTVGRAPDGTVPGLLVAPEDPAALAGALRRWLTDAALRDRLRAAALARRDTLTGWSVTARRVSDILLVPGALNRLLPGSV